MFTSSKRLAQQIMMDKVIKDFWNKLKPDVDA